MSKLKQHKKDNSKQPKPLKAKVHVVDNYPAKCPDCNIVLSVYPFDIRKYSNMRNPNGRICIGCNKLFLDVHAFYKCHKFFYATNYEDIKPYLDDIEKQRQEKHELKMQKTSEKNRQKEEFFSKLQNAINKSGITQFPEWRSILRKSSLDTLGRISFAFLIQRTSMKCEWYFITNEGRKSNHVNNNGYIVGPESIMGRALLESKLMGSTQVKIVGNMYDILFSDIVNTDYADIILNKVFTEMNNVECLAKKYSRRVYVYFKLNNKCVNNKHRIETLTAKTTNIKTGLAVGINVFHCLDCDKYFINYEALQNYISKGIYPALDFSLAEIDEGKLRDVSELMIYGYTVKEGVLNESERHRILAWIIDTGLLSKGEIIKDLQFKVNYNGKKIGNENAKKKWQLDIQFVSQYVKGNTKSIDAIFERS